ncbi:MAG TPA: efflux RND transporter permease subunit [Methylomirabilota bacterium]|nr:efflux RND transporter permease subunit [Methylomirabilota bacterium]
MVAKLVLFSLRNRLIILSLAGLLLAVGVVAASRSPLDIFPEFAPPQMVIQTEALGLSAEEVEALITIPLEYALNGTNGLTMLRSSSAPGISVITAIFADRSDVLLDRMLVNERLASVVASLPQGAGPPRLTPMTSSTGTLMSLGLTATDVSPMELRTMADWTLRPRLLSVPGVAGVVVYGGEVKEYQVLVSPERLRRFDLTLEDITTAGREAVALLGAGYLDSVSQRLPIRGEGGVEAIADIQAALVGLRDGAPLTLGQVADVRIGAAVKVGDATVGGESGVMLIVTKQPGANTLEVSQRVDAVLDELQSAMPAGVQLHRNLFRQSTFIESALHNMRRALVLGTVLVISVLLCFLAEARTAVISLTAIPLSLLSAVAVLWAWGVPLNTMTLGGLVIAIGEVVDDAIIDVENIHRRLRENATLAAPHPALRVVYEASVEVRSAVVYASFIVAVVVLPLFVLSGVQGRIFAPLGAAYVLAILASLLVALTVTPALALALLTQERTDASEGRLARSLKTLYARLLPICLAQSRFVMGISLFLVIGSGIALVFLRSNFLPEFHEGNLIVQMTGVPGMSLDESVRMTKRVSQLLQRIPGVVSLAEFTGRASLSEDTWGPEASEFHIVLDPQREQYAEIIETIRAQLEEVPGFSFNVLSYLKERMEEVMAGATAQVAVKIFGPDLAILRALGQQTAHLMSAVPGVVDLVVEPQVDIPQVTLRFDRQALARYGLTVGRLKNLVTTAFLGASVAQVYEFGKVFNLVVRFSEAARNEVTALGNALISVPGGARVPLRTLAAVQIEPRPNVINRENASRRLVVQCNIAGGNAAGVTQEIERRLREKIVLPQGYYLEVGGEYKEQLLARRELLLLGAAALLGVFLLLYADFHSVRDALLVLGSLPLALIGVVWTVALSGGELSLGSGVGMLALLGVTARNGIMLVAHYRRLRRDTVLPFSRELIVQGSLDRLVPILMTALVAALGLLPLALSGQRAGQELEHPLAVVLLGGLFTSTLLNLVVMPVLYLHWGDNSAEIEGGGLQ